LTETPFCHRPFSELWLCRAVRQANQL